jgi:hypothetical protein
MSFNKRNNLSYQDLPIWAKFIFAIVCILGLFKLYKAFRSGISLGKSIGNDIKNSAQAAGIKDALNQNGVTDVRASAVEDAANDIGAAFFKDSFWGFGEDEPKAVNAFNGLKNVGEAKACAHIYRASFNKSLYSNLETYCNGSNWRNLKSTYLIAIKNI